MFQNILGAVSGYRTVLVLTGWSHVGGFIRHFLAAGYHVSPFSSAEKVTLFDTSGRVLSFPPEMVHYIQKRIDIDRAAVQRETDEAFRVRLERAIALRERLLAIVARAACGR